MTNPWKLTPRQIEVIEALIETGNNDEIGMKLGMKSQTVRANLFRACNKVGAQNRVQLAISWERFRAKQETATSTP